MFRYKTRGTCSSMIEIETENGVIGRVAFRDGCKGNLAAIAKLVEGMKIDDAISKLSGIRCGANPTSCADQLARALAEMKQG